MTLIGTLTVVWYSVLPWLWLLSLMLVIFLVPQILARLRGYRFSAPWGIGAKVMPPLAFVLCLFLLPLHTQSSISYVNTWVDWLNLIGASLATAVYAWLVFHPLCFLRSHCSRCRN